MTVRLLGGEDRPDRERSEVAKLDEVAAKLRDQALASAREPLAPAQHNARLADLFQLPAFRAAFLDALALGVALALASHDRRVLAVYVHAADAAAEARPALGAGARVHLLVLVTAPSAALEVFIVSLNRALGMCLSETAGAPLSLAEPLLDISIVTEQHVRQGVGLGRLLSAVRPPPVKLWQREV